MWENWTLEVLALEWPNFGLCDLFGSEPTNVRCLSLFSLFSPSLSLCVCNCQLGFQINKQITEGKKERDIEVDFLGLILWNDLGCCWWLAPRSPEELLYIAQTKQVHCQYRICVLCTKYSCILPWKELLPAISGSSVNERAWFFLIQVEFSSSNAIAQVLCFVVWWRQYGLYIYNKIVTQSR